MYSLFSQMIGIYSKFTLVKSRFFTTFNLDLFSQLAEREFVLCHQT